MSPKLSLLIKLILSFLALGYLSTQLSWVDFMSHIQRLTIIEILIFVSIAIGVLALGAKRWQAIIALSGHSIPFKYLFQANLVGHCFSQCLPSSVGGDVYRVIAARQGGIETAPAIMGTLADRFFGFLGLSLLVLVILPFEWSYLSQTFLVWPIITVLGIAMSLSLTIILFPYWEKILMKYQKYLKLAPLLIFLKEIRNLRYLKIVLLYAVLGSLGLIGELYYLNLALDLNLSPSLLLVTMPLVFMFMSLPISFAGWGLREGAMIVVLGVYGVSKESALMLSLIYGILMLITALPGLVIWFWKLRGTSQAVYSD